MLINTEGEIGMLNNVLVACQSLNMDEPICPSAAKNTDSATMNNTSLASFFPQLHRF
jgi:hypothetical protein